MSKSFFSFFKKFTLHSSTPESVTNSGTSSLTITWLGIRLIDGKWQWSINGEMVEASFTNWDNNVMPNDPEKTCAVFDGWANGVWRAVDCNQQYRSICKTDAYHPPN
ncbi:unnamed protein product, partial [Mesorhabditis belari]|uniref:C-type lectin domain-containing protein n=1 Tax=Mesorhabditis belari TaxID=2138241 RepID=A0AAF3FAH2_9BILA